MIITKAKDKDKLLDSVKKFDSFFLVGCSECAALCGTGSNEAMEDMSKMLQEEGKTVTGMMMAKSGCQTLGSKTELKKFKDETNSADAILVMSCGAGTQSAVEIFPDKPVYPANDSLFLGNMTRFQKFDERCSLCGECIIDKTGGICPVTNCPKGLLNGPCGGMSDGKCEVSPDLPCAWVKIYERQKTLDNLNEMEDIIAPKDWSAGQKPRDLYTKKDQDKKGTAKKD